MNLRPFLAVVGLSASLSTTLLATTSALAQDSPIKVGVVAPMSGEFGVYGKQIENGINVFLRESGDLVGGRKVQIIYRDNHGPNPALAKRLAQELVTNDKVDVLAGFAFTPDAMAAAPIATESKRPLIAMLSATSSVVGSSPYLVRTSYTIPQTAWPMGQWAAKSKIKRVFTLVSDYGPGYDAETWFKKGFTEGGGEIVGEVRVPVKNKDFAPFLQRIRDAKPDAVFTFLPAGEPIIAFMKGFSERGMAQAGIKLLATEGWADDDTLTAAGDAAIGAISTGYYSTANPSALNKQFLANYQQVSGGKLQPNFIAVAAYDGMRLLSDAVKRTGGKSEADGLMAAFKGAKLDSPRGPMTIDADTRDVVQTIYVRRVEKSGAGLKNVEFDQFVSVKDPGK
ncbi:ABC transporter substrate-binding protein [Variovorax sp. HJSM1_2]|uniref:ABC transporter substrate-binding protein n=1 Tax=Variovorax sp. HJSM1_2 TaxID=3366263 RepID=UPI003BCC28C9